MDQSAHSFPVELLDQFHAATERFHETRMEWEKSLEDVQYRHEERVEAAREKLQQAERELEAVEERIQAALKTTH